MGALNDLGDEQNGGGYQPNNPNFGEGQSHFNIHELNMFNRGNFIKQEQEQKPLQLYNNWMNRANELLDLSSSDSRDTPQSSEPIPQILMNPWDPNSQPIMNLAPIANAMQQYQQQWLTQYQAAVNDGESFPLGKFRVLCISADEDMGFLINLPAPCNLLFQETADGKLAGKQVVTGFMIAFQKFLKEPPVEEQKRILDLTEAPKTAPAVLPGKKAYIEPYTPKASVPTGSKEKVSSTGFSRSIVVPEVRRKQSSPSKTGLMGKAKSIDQMVRSKAGVKRSRSDKNDDEEKELLKAIEAIPDVPLVRESSRRKAKEGASTKRKTQQDLLLDPDDPTLNNPALDLDDSDVDDDWTPAKEKDKDGRKKRGGDSSDDDDFMDGPERGDNGKFLSSGGFRGKKRSAMDSNGPGAKRLATSDSDLDLNSLGPLDVRVDKTLQKPLRD